MKTLHIIALVVVAFSVAILFTVLSSTTSYASFEEAKAAPDKKFHVVGTWAKEYGMTYDPLKNANYFEFPMRDSLNNLITVYLNDAKPNDFERGEKVVVVGKMDGQKFHASEILMKCPSKYNAEAPGIKQTSL